MKTLIIVLAIAVLLLYMKWILLVVLYPLQALAAVYRNHPSAYTKILAAPNAVFERTIGGRYTIYHLSTLPSMRLRRWLYKGLGAHIGKDVVMHFKTEIRAPHRLHIGKGTIIGDNALLDARCGLVMGENVNLSSNVSVMASNYLKLYKV